MLVLGMYGFGCVKVEREMECSNAYMLVWLEQNKQWRDSILKTSLLIFSSYLRKRIHVHHAMQN